LQGILGRSIEPEYCSILFLITSDELNTKLRLADATKAMNDKHLATREVELLGEEVLLQFLHIAVSLHEVIDGGNTLQTERGYMRVLDIRCQLWRTDSTWSAGDGLLKETWYLP